MMIRFLYTAKTLFVLAGLVWASAPAAAQEPKLLGTYADWLVYAYKTSSTRVCYIVSQPKSSEPKGANRDPIFFLVTHRPGNRVRNEVNTIIGYPFRKGSKTKLQIDTGQFTLFTSGDGAWAESPARDRQIVSAMKKGSSMVVTGVSSRGTTTIDRYSLAGVTAAMDKIDAICK